MKLEEALTKRILALCKERDITPNKLANMAGMPRGSLTSIFYGKSLNTGIRTINELCQALDITIFDFFNDDLFKNKEIENNYIRPLKK